MDYIKVFFRTYDKKIIIDYCDNPLTKSDFSAYKNVKCVLIL